MKQSDRNALLSVLVVILVGVGVAWAGSQGGASALGIPLFALGVALAFLIQWAVFIPAFLQQTEKFFDLTGAATYISVTTLAVLLSPVKDGRSLLLLALVVIWAGPPGHLPLFAAFASRERTRGSMTSKPSFAHFLSTWTLQALWVTLTLSAALAAITTTTRKGLGPFALIGFLVWAIGFAIEATADSQKNRFRADPENKGDFIDTGLWAWSRHPQLLWRDHALDRRAHHRPPGPAGLAVDRADLTHLRHPAAHSCRRRRRWKSGRPGEWGGQADYETYELHAGADSPASQGSVRC